MTPYPEDTPIATNSTPADVLDILAGINSNVENHRKRLKLVEDLNTSAKIVNAVKDMQTQVAALQGTLKTYQNQTVPKTTTPSPTCVPSR
jgi:hypothetical protein